MSDFFNAVGMGMDLAIVIPAGILFTWTLVEHFEELVASPIGRLALGGIALAAVDTTADYRHDPPSNVESLGTLAGIVLAVLMVRAYRQARRAGATTEEGTS